MSAEDDIDLENRTESRCSVKIKKALRNFHNFTN